MLSVAKQLSRLLGRPFAALSVTWQRSLLRYDTLGMWASHLHTGKLPIRFHPAPGESL